MFILHVLQIGVKRAMKNLLLSDTSAWTDVSKREATQRMTGFYIILCKFVNVFNYHSFTDKLLGNAQILKGLID